MADDMQSDNASRTSNGSYSISGDYGGGYEPGIYDGMGGQSYPRQMNGQKHPMVRRSERFRTRTSGNGGTFPYEQRMSDRINGSMIDPMMMDGYEDEWEDDAPMEGLGSMMMPEKGSSEKLSPEMKAYLKYEHKALDDIGHDTDSLIKMIGGKEMGESYDSGVLTGMLAQRGIDPGLVAMLRDNNGFGGGSGGLLFLLFLVILMGNGSWGGFNGGGLNSVDRTVINEGNFNQLMTAISSSGQAQTAAVQALANNLNTDTSAITTALAGVDKQIAVNQGSIINAIQSCCCNIRTELQSTSAATQLATERGFNAQNGILNAGFNGLQNQASQIAFAESQQSSQNTQSILNAITGQTAVIQDQFCQLKNREDAREIQILRDKLAEQRDQSNLAMVLAAIRNKDTIATTVTGTLDATSGVWTGTGTGTLS